MVCPANQTRNFQLIVTGKLGHLLKAFYRHSLISQLVLDLHLKLKPEVDIKPCLEIGFGGKADVANQR